MFILYIFILFFSILFYHYTFCMYSIYVSQTQQCIVIIITLYNVGSSKETKRWEESKWIFIAFVMLTISFTISGSLHLWIHYHLLSLPNTTLFASSFYCYWQIYPRSIYHRPNSMNIYIIIHIYNFVQLLFKSIKEKKCTFILPLQLCSYLYWYCLVFPVCLNYSLGLFALSLKNFLQYFV